MFSSPLVQTIAMHVAVALAISFAYLQFVSGEEKDTTKILVRVATLVVLTHLVLHFIKGQDAVAAEPFY